MPTYRLSTSARGQFWLAVIPLACLAIGRGLLEIESAIDARLTDLAALDARIAEGRARLGTILAAAPAPEPEPEPHRDEWEKVPEFTEQCFDCARPASARTVQGWPVCPDHDPTVRLA